MGKYKKLIFTISILLISLFFNKNVFAESMKLNDFEIKPRVTNVSYQNGTRTGNLTYNKLLSYGQQYMDYGSNLLIDSSSLLSPLYYTYTIDFSGLDFDFLSFNVLVRGAQLSNVGLWVVKGSCQSYSSSSFNENGTNFTGYNIICNNITPQNKSNAQIIFYLNGFKMDSGVNLYLTRYATTGKYDLSTTNNLLEEANQKQQEAIDKQQETNDKLDKVDDSINNSDVTDSTDTATGFFNDFESSDFGLSDVIKMPLTFINNFTSSTCTDLILPLPFVDNDVTLPCMTNVYKKYFGSFLTIYQTITFGIVAYWVCINIFAMVKGFKDPESDKVEVFDL